MSYGALIDRAGARAVEHAPFGARTTYRVGGTARVVLELGELEDLRELSPLIRATGAPVVVLGNGSNTLVADGEFDGVVLVLGRGFTRLEWREVDGVVVVSAGAALDLPVAARRLAEAGITGFEWAVGVPGTFGGAAVMNAGGHGSDMAHCVERVDAWSLRRDRLAEFSVAQLDYGYRRSTLGADDVVVEVTLALGRGDPEAARAQIAEIVRWRRAHQPGGANAGSVFANPPEGPAGRLIEEAGCKGLSRGGARVSDKHANFIVAEPGARAEDVLALMLEVRARVEAATGVRLASEVRTVGFEGRWP